MDKTTDQGSGSGLLLEARPRDQDCCALAFLSEPRMSWLETLDTRPAAKRLMAGFARVACQGDAPDHG